MAAFRRSVITLHNPSTRLQIALQGGAIIDFHRTSNNINPLTFAFTKEQMPERNRKGAVYQGHFLCLGRWGEPSEGEKKAGLPDHGQFANQDWISNDSNHNYVHMFAESKREGLRIDREITLDAGNSIFVCKEMVTNPGDLGKVYNMVQHPTIAAPFLTPATMIFCNAGDGYHFAHHREVKEFSARWPFAKLNDLTETDIRNSLPSQTSVNSFVVQPDQEWGWILAWNPEQNLLVGYIWRRKDYPWINLWRDYTEGAIRYRGLEFGTSGVHQPFSEIVSAGCYEVFDQKVFDYIDAGESLTRSYCSFLIEPAFPVTENISIDIKKQHVLLKYDSGEEQINLPVKTDSLWKS